MPSDKNPQQIVTFNFAAKMDTRTNDEILDITAANDRGLELYNLQNGDLFYTKSLAVRQGVIDVCGGIINASGAATPVYTLYSGTGTVNGFYPEPVFFETSFPDREGMIINFASQGASGINTFNLYGGTILMRDTYASYITNP